MAEQGPGSANGSGSASWRASLGASGGSEGSGGSDQAIPLSPTPPAVPPHSHHFQQQQNQINHHPKERERDRDKNNHDTVVNLLSMLTIGVDHQQQPHQQNFGNDSNQSGPSKGSNSSSTNSPVDHQRMLLLSMANSPESCLALRRAGCIPLLIELMHPSQSLSDGGIQAPEIIRTRATKALRNIVQFNPDEKVKRKELRVLKLLEGIRLFSEAVRALLKVKQEQTEGDREKETDKAVENIQHPTTNITTLMKLSFDEEHRNTMCLLGAINALADLIVSDHNIHGNCASELKDDCLLIRRYSGMTLTNLTFGDGTNKALLCGMRDFLPCLVKQLDCENEDICQVTASVLRNLSWHADSSSRASLRDSDAVPKLTLAAIKSTKESTLKATLSALWNLSAHSATNKSAICLASSNSLAFMISLLRPNNPVMKQMKTPMLIIENAGGILRNISSQISTSSELRKMLRESHCYEILLEHLKSSSLTVVSNACGTLWNLSGGTDCEEDQRKLLDLNAIPMLKSLVYSKHERISQGASAALRNLLSSRFAKDHTLHLDSRLTAQIYSPSHSTQGEIFEQGQKSPGSDTEFELDLNLQQHPQESHNQIQQPHPQIVQHDPPAAHQQSSAAAASFFQRNFNSSHNKPLVMQFHNYPPFPTNSAPNSFRHTHRPSTINYAPDHEPLDLTMTSAKSSPIHVISAAEFGIIGNHSMPHQNQRSAVGGRFYRPKSQNQSHGFLNAPNLIHHTEGETSGRKYSFPGAKFNQSCPEILSRFQQNINPAHHQIVPEVSKPLDYSSTSASTTSSTRGAGEAAGIGISSDSNNGGGDTTFNYSLRFTELEADEEARMNSRNHHQSNNNNTSNNTKSEDDTVKTYCYEGTPHNFSISNSCQDLVQELEFEKEAAARDGTNANGERNPSTEGNMSNTSNKLQPIDEVPKAYYVENTPAVFSRTSSLSSINSSGGMNAGENRAEYNDISHNNGQGQNVEPSILKRPTSLQHKNQETFSPPMCQIPPQPMPRKKPILVASSGYQPHPLPRVTFSAEETPLMFSRSSSVASLDSLDVGLGANGSGTGTALKNDDELSDYSRRASEVVSPSDLPDSPRALAPPVRIYEQHHSIKSRIAENRKMDEAMEINDKSGDEDAIKVFSLEEKSGLNSCRSLSPLMVDGEELPIIGKGKLDSSSKGGTSTNASGSTTIENKSSMSILRQEQQHVQVHSDGSTYLKREMDHKQEERDTFCNKPPLGKPGYDDELKIFAMEGTPFYGVSNATSLSDLTMDIEESLAETVTIVQSNKTENGINSVSQTVDTDSELKKNPIPISSTLVELKTQQQVIIEEEPIYSDAQLLEKCIRVGKSIGIPKSQSEFKIGANNNTINPLGKPKSPSSSTNNLMTMSLDNSGSKGESDDDDADLAALIMIGRNRTKEKESKKGKVNKKIEKEPFNRLTTKPPTGFDSTKNLEENTSQIKEESKETVAKQESTDESDKGLSEQSKSSSLGATQSDTQGISLSSKGKDFLLNAKSSQSIDPNQISIISLGSEWNDDTPTLSSPIPSMSISTALKLAGSVGGDSSMSKPPVLLQIKKEVSTEKKQTYYPNDMNASSISVSMNHELLDNIEPPSTFSNLVSSTDCVLQNQSPQLNPRSQHSTLSDKVNKKWKALNDPGNQSSTYSNLSGQKPPPDFDLENSMISVASIRSEIYEMSFSSMNNEVFESAVEDFGEGNNVRLSLGDHSLANTYTIFPPENANRLSGVKSTDLSDGGNTVVSEDFTDAEDIEDFETAPADDDHINEEVNNTHENKSEKTELGKETRITFLNDNISIINANPLVIQTNELQNASGESAAISAKGPQSPVQSVQPMSKPLMEVHPLDTTNKYNTYVVKRSPIMSSPKSSPRQKRRDDPERYRTRTINPMGNKPMSDANGNPEMKFATFKVCGPRISKQVNMNSTRESESSISPESTPGNSPKGIRGRRKPLYSSLPPSSIVRKNKTAPPPPIPPKPTSGRAASPARSISSSTSGGGVYVRPTRTTELRIAANNSRENSPRRGDANSSKNSSNSSLNALHHLSSRFSDTGLSTASAPSRPKVAPKPPVRTTPSIASTSSSNEAGIPRGFAGSSSNFQIKVSNSSFGFGQQARIGDSGLGSNMKGYSTLPKSSKLGTVKANPAVTSTDKKLGYREDSRESIAGSEKSGKSGIGKLSNLFKKMDFRGHGKESSSLPIPVNQNPYHVNSKIEPKIKNEDKAEKPKSTGSKFSNLFGRNKTKDSKNSKQQLQPFLEAVPLPNTTTITATIPSYEDHTTDTFPSHDTLSNTTGGVWVRRDGDNKVIVPPFNYTPPGSHKRQDSLEKEEGNSSNQQIIHAPNNAGGNESGQSNNNALGSAKITTV